MAYATYSNVQTRNPYRTIGASTKPSQTDVTAWIAETDALINGALYAAEIHSDSYGADALLILQSWCVDRVSGLLRMAYASAGGDANNPDGQILIKQFDDLIKDIAKRPAFYGAMLFAGAAPSAAIHARGLVLDGSDGTEVIEDYRPTFQKARGGDQF